MIKEMRTYKYDSVACHSYAIAVAIRKREKQEKAIQSLHFGALPKLSKSDSDFVLDEENKQHINCFIRNISEKMQVLIEMQMKKKGLTESDLQ